MILPKNDSMYSVTLRDGRQVDGWFISRKEMFVTPDGREALDVVSWKNIDLGPLPEVHERLRIVQRAQTELGGLIMEWAKKHDLTLVEQALILSRQVPDVLRYVLREERHGTTEKKADEKG